MSPHIVLDISENNPMWSDWRTTYQLLSIRNRPDQMVKSAVQSWPQVEVAMHGLDDPGVGLGELLNVSLPGKVLRDVLMQERN